MYFLGKFYECLGVSLFFFFPFSLLRRNRLLENGYTKEEMKLVHETQKILDNKELKITATAVRVPVNGGHSESINVSFKKEIDIDEIKSII